MPLDVAIVAAQARTALAPDLAGTWDALLAGRSAVGPVVGFDATGFGGVEAAQIWREPEGVEDDPALRILGAHGRLLDALALDVHAAADLGALPRERVGLFVGMGMVDSAVVDLAPAVLGSRASSGDLDLKAFFAGGYRAVHPLWPLSMLGNVAVGQVAMDLDLRGDNCVLASDADAGLRALLEGARAVADGSATAVLAAGVGEAVSPATLARRALRGRLRAGVVPGEGGAAFVFEDRASAAARARPLLGIIRGGATVFGGAAGGAAPTAATLGRAADRALGEAGFGPADVDLVFLPGANTAAEDEAARLHLAAAGVRNCAFLAPRLGIGHLGAAAAAVDLGLALRALGAGAAPCEEEAAVADAPRVPVARPLRALILAAGGHGGAGALVVEAAA